MNQHVWWYLARASGVVTWCLVTASVVLGLWLSLRLTKKFPRPAWTLDLHRFLGALAVVFTGVHLAGLVADSYVHFGAAQLFVPLASSWKPDAVAWGIVGLYLLVAIEATSLAMRWIPRKLWRGVHLTSYVLFVLVTVHMFTAGTDASRPSLQWLGLGGVTIVGFLTCARLLASRRAPRSASRRAPRPASRAARARRRSQPQPALRRANRGAPARARRPAPATARR